MHVSQGLCLQIPTQAGGAGVCQGHQHHGRQQISVLRRHKFITQWGTGQIQHQQEVHCIDKLGSTQASTFAERDKHHMEKSAFYYQGGGKRGEGAWPTIRAGAGAAPAHTGSCTVPGEPPKHCPPLDDTMHLSTHKWVGVLGPCQEC